MRCPPGGRLSEGDSRPHSYPITRKEELMFGLIGLLVDIGIAGYTTYKISTEE